MAEKAEEPVLEHMIANNKPTNAKSLADLLQSKGIKKQHVTDALESLVKKEKLNYVDNNKQRIYIPPQENAEVLSPEEVSNLEAENQTKEQELSSLSEEVNAISREAQSYENAKSIEQLNSGAEQKEQRIAELEPALEEMRASAGSISDEQRDRLLNLAVTFFERWCARRRMFVSALDSICEHADQNVQSLKEEIGLEWDSDHGLDRKNCKQRVDHWRQQQQRRQMCRPAKTARTVQ